MTTASQPRNKEAGRVDTPQGVRYIDSGTSGENIPVGW